jgi:hypothetical protein
LALFEDIAKGSTPGGILVGIGAGLLAPVLAPAVTGVLRPAAKALLRTGITVYRSAMEPITAEVGSLVAEAQLEMATASAAAAASTAAPEPAETTHKPRQQKRPGGSQHA